MRQRSLGTRPSSWRAGDKHLANDIVGFAAILRRTSLPFATLTTGG